MHYASFLTLMLMTTLATGQSVSTRMGARHAGMGYASFALGDESGLLGNVAGLAKVHHHAVTFNQEIVPDLTGGNRSSAGLIVTSPFGTLGLNVFRFGDNIYREQMISIGFAHEIGTTALGMRMNYIQYEADGFGTTGTSTLDFAGLTSITPHLFVGAGIFNLTQSTIASGEKLPVILTAAIAYQPGKSLHAVFEVEKKLGSPVVFKGGVEAGISKKVFLRTGFNLHPASLFGGIGALTHRLNIDSAVSFNRLYGFVYQASATYKLGRQKDL